LQGTVTPSSFEFGGSSPPAPTLALVAQLDRALDYGSRGSGFDSLPVH